MVALGFESLVVVEDGSDGDGGAGAGEPLLEAVDAEGVVAGGAGLLDACDGLVGAGLVVEQVEGGGVEVDVEGRLASGATDRATDRANGITAITPERVIREGDPTEQMIDVIEKDVDITMLVLAANPGPEGPGPIITTMANAVGTFPVPVIIVPGDLTDAQIDALS